MKVLENVTVICRSIGENDIYVFENENTGETIKLENLNGIELELGAVGVVTYNQLPVKYIVSFEPVMVEELV